jgi:SNF2 family DNA or RNA helicase
MIKGTKIRLIGPYQHEGVKWMLARERDSKISGGFMCDEMGLGKTVQTIAVMHSNPKPKTLIVVPKSIVSQWSQEINRFVPSWKVCAYDGPKRTLIEDFNVCVAPYSVIHDDNLKLVKWDRVILDEAHDIRNPNSKMFAGCQDLKAPIRWVLTGTPVFNSIRDFKTLCAFIGISGGDVNRYHEQICKDYVIRRTKADLRVKMVSCEFQNVELEMSEPEKALYSLAYEEFTDTIRYGANMMAILEGLLRCRQVCVWPQLYYNGVAKKEDKDPEQWTGLTTKLEYLVNSLKEHPDEKSLIFTQFTGEANKIQELLTGSHQIFRLDGHIDTSKRESIIEGFKGAKPGAVFIIQIKTGGVGLNLQCASRVYITHPAWNPATELQAIARAHRGGQTKVVHVKKLVYVGEDSVENEIVELQNAKSIVCAQVLNDPRLLEQVPKIQNVSKFIFRIGKRLRPDVDN